MKALAACVQGNTLHCQEQTVYTLLSFHLFTLFGRTCISVKKMFVKFFCTEIEHGIFHVSEPML